MKLNIQTDKVMERRHKEINERLLKGIIGRIHSNNYGKRQASG